MIVHLGHLPLAAVFACLRRQGAHQQEYRSATLLTMLLEDNWETAITAIVRVIHEARVREIDIPVREALYDLCQDDSPFKSGQRLAEAVVSPEAEVQVLARLPRDVEAVGSENTRSSRPADGVSVATMLSAGIVSPWNSK
jgi:hypothetical protein